MHFFFCQSRGSSWLDYRTGFISFLHITAMFISVMVKENLLGAAAYTMWLTNRKKRGLQTKICAMTIFCLIFLFWLFICINVHVISQSYTASFQSNLSKTIRHAGFYKKQCFIYVILWKNNYIPFLKNTEDNEIKKWELDNVCCTPFWTVFSATKNSTIR